MIVPRTALLGLLWLLEGDSNDHEELALRALVATSVRLGVAWSLRLAVLAALILWLGLGTVASMLLVYLCTAWAE